MNNVIKRGGTPNLSRRTLMGAAAASPLLFSPRAMAADTVKIAAVLPLAGAFAVSGKDLLNGAQLAVDEINAAGGIKSIGGQHLELMPGDAGQSPETAVTTARRLLGNGPVAAIGCWYSSLSLAATQVAEQRKVPWLTGSIADAIVGRGFKYVFQTSDGSEDSAQGLIDAIVAIIGKGEARLAVIADNNTANVDVIASFKKKVSVPFVSNQSWTPPLSDATPAVSALMQSKPNVIYLGATSTSDQVLLIKQLAAQGNTAPIIMGASSACNPVFLDAVGAKAVEGVVVVTGIPFPGRGSDALVAKYAAAYKEPFMGCEALTGYVNTHIIALGLEKAGKADPMALRDALAGLDATDVPALKLLPGGDRIQFGPNGRRKGVTVEFVQWQGGKPHVVHPPEFATGELKRKYLAAPRRCTRSSSSLPDCSKAASSRC